ncbi:FAD-binding protein [Micromonospora sp. C97]|uniref:sensory rhodopsin transducer n=1 Tax=Micromonospora sp. C97 TaxID=2824883 RepID=UPI001B372D5B|nr:sensory rhodopsin transducer [Micromonospora sp. C97]MBQ1034381.1 FAD-binding protein [Micromonospora sp. C97]
MRQFVNWSGSLSFTPREFAEPADEDAVRELVVRARESGRTIRPVGSGHSSSPLTRTDDILLSVDRLAGVIAEDADRARACAGTKLKALGEGLYDAGLAMDNLGDVDYQSIAGATATGTHGTGVGFGNLCTQVVGVRLVTGTGEVLDISADDNADLTSFDQLCVLNTTDTRADTELHLYYADAEPVGPYAITVDARRVRHVRLNDLIDPEAVRLDRPYGCLLRSPVPVVVQFLRQDTRLPGVVALTAAMAYPA